MLLLTKFCYDFICLRAFFSLFLEFLLSIIFIWQFDKLALVWGKPRQPPLGSEEVRADDLS